MSKLSEKAARSLAALREKKPLIHNITNFVAMNYTANALLAMGASPMMAHAENEVKELVSSASALVLNIGTPSKARIAAMIIAGKKATALNMPIVLDPVGSGTGSFRTSSAATIIDQTRVSVIRGNASEILSLHRSDIKIKGIDAVHSVDEAAEIAGILAGEIQATLAITGPEDLVTDGDRTIRVRNGHPLMGYVTGTGCVSTATIGAFLTVEDDLVSATAASLAFLGLAGEKAAEKAAAPGSFKSALIDALYTITPADLAIGARFKECF
ncbi:MAG: hydroxyethylthiazole kinase [Nitrospinales bacterium]